MSDNMMRVLDTLDVILGELRERDEQLENERAKVASLHRRLANQYALNDKLLGKRNALRNKLALIGANDQLDEEE